MSDKMSVMPAKRIFIQVSCPTQEYKDRYKQLLEAKYNITDAERLMSMDIRALLEWQYPALVDDAAWAQFLADRERKGA